MDFVLLKFEFGGVGRFRLVVLLLSTGLTGFWVCEGCSSGKGCECKSVASSAIYRDNIGPPFS